MSDKILQKLNNIDKAYSKKLDRLTPNDTITEIVDADTIVTSSYPNSRSSDPTGIRYDAVETKHGDNPYMGVGTDYEKSQYAQQKQKEETARMFNKSIEEVTQQDMIDLGNQQKIQKLADLTREEGQERWIAPLIKNSENVELKNLNIPVRTIPNNKQGEKGRGLVSYINPNTGDNITHKAAMDADQNAFAKQYYDNPLDSLADLEVQKVDNSGNIPYRIKNTGAAAASMFTQGVGGLGDFIAEVGQAIGNSTSIDALHSDGEGIWKDGELAKKSNELYNYDTTFAEEAQKEVEEAYKSGDKWKMAKAVINGFFVPELWGTSGGFVLSMGVPGGAVKTITMARKANQLVKAGRFANKAKAMEVLEKAENQANKVQKVFMNLTRVQPGAVGYAQNYLGDARTEFKEKYGREMTPMEQAATFGMGMLSANTEYWVDAGLLKGKNLVSDAFKKMFKTLPVEEQKRTLTKLATTKAGHLLESMLVEGGQEILQGGIEGYGIDMHEKSFSDSMKDREVSIMSQGLLGASGGPQFKVSGVIYKHLASAPRNVQKLIPTKKIDKMDTVEEIVPKQELSKTRQTLKPSVDEVGKWEQSKLDNYLKAKFNNQPHDLSKDDEKHVVNTFIDNIEANNDTITALRKEIDSGKHNPEIVASLEAKEKELKIENANNLATLNKLTNNIKLGNRSVKEVEKDISNIESSLNNSNIPEEEKQTLNYKRNLYRVEKFISEQLGLKDKSSINDTSTSPIKANSIVQQKIYGGYSKEAGNKLGAMDYVRVLLDPKTKPKDKSDAYLGFKEFIAKQNGKYIAAMDAQTKWNELAKQTPKGDRIPPIEEEYGVYSNGTPAKFVYHGQQSDNIINTMEKENQVLQGIFNFVEKINKKKPIQSGPDTRNNSNNINTNDKVIDKVINNNFKSKGKLNEETTRPRDKRINEVEEGRSQTNSSNEKLKETLKQEVSRQKEEIITHKNDINSLMQSLTDAKVSIKDNAKEYHKQLSEATERYLSVYESLTSSEKSRLTKQMNKTFGKNTVNNIKNPDEVYNSIIEHFSKDNESKVEELLHNINKKTSKEQFEKYVDKALEFNKDNEVFNNYKKIITLDKEISNQVKEIKTLKKELNKISNELNKVKSDIKDNVIKHYNKLIDKTDNHIVTVSNIKEKISILKDNNIEYVTEEEKVKFQELSNTKKEIETAIEDKQNIIKNNKELKKNTIKSLKGTMPGNILLEATNKPNKGIMYIKEILDGIDENLAKEFLECE